MLERSSKVAAFLLAHCRTPRFANHLRRLLQLTVSFDSMAIVICPLERSPIDVYHWSRERCASEAYQKNYLSFAYQIDPFHQRLQQPFKPDIYLLADVAPDLFQQTAYFKTFYTAANIQDEATLLMRHKQGAAVQLSLARSHALPAFSREELLSLQAIQALVIELVLLHCEGYLNTPNSEEEGRAQTLEQRLLQWSQQALEDPLTPRQAEVAALLLRGHSSLSIGLVLDIAIDTVKAHRKSLYRKLNVATQAQLFARLFDLTH